MPQTERFNCVRLLQRPSEMAALAARVAGGEVFVYPTETIYGVGGRADSAAVRERILDVKGRSADNPMILIGAARSAFDSFGLQFSLAAEALAKAFWPGRITLVVPSADGRFVGVRVSDHPFIAALAAHFDMPLFSSSANKSGTEYNGDPKALLGLFDGAVDFVVDDGALPFSRPSTVVKVFADGAVEFIREGAIQRKAVEAVLAGC